MKPMRAFNNFAGFARFLVRAGLRRRIPAFLHVPKTGGTYLAQNETNRRPIIRPMKYIGHYFVVASLDTPRPVFPPAGFRPTFIVEKRALEPYFVFTTVRNPYSFLVSYLWHAGGLNPKYHNPNHYDFTNARKGFDYLLKAISDRDEPWPSRKFIHAQLFCDDGDLIVDWINRTEFLDSDLTTMVRHLNIKYNPKQPQRVARTDDYRSYYTDELVNIVQRIWGRELRLFGYDFDGQSTEKTALCHMVTPQQKKSIHYYWENDLLQIDDNNSTTRYSKHDFSTGK